MDICKISVQIISTKKQLVMSLANEKYSEILRPRCVMCAIPHTNIGAFGSPKHPPKIHVIDSGSFLLGGQVLRAVRYETNSNLKILQKLGVKDLDFALPLVPPPPPPLITPFSFAARIAFLVSRSPILIICICPWLTKT